MGVDMAKGGLLFGQQSSNVSTFQPTDTPPASAQPVPTGLATRGDIVSRGSGFAAPVNPARDRARAAYLAALETPLGLNNPDAYKRSTSVSVDELIKELPRHESVIRALDLAKGLSGKPNGKLTVKEIEANVARGRVITPLQLIAAEKAIAALQGEYADGFVPIERLSGLSKTLAQHALALTSRAEASVSVGDIVKLGNVGMDTSLVGDLPFISLQELAVIKHAVALRTREKVALSVGAPEAKMADALSSLTGDSRYLMMRWPGIVGVYDAAVIRRTSIASFTVYASEDARYAVYAERKYFGFFASKEMNQKGLATPPEVYSGAYKSECGPSDAPDKGHLVGLKFLVTPKGQADSMRTENMEAECGMNNSVVKLNYQEEAARALVETLKARAVYGGGGLYLTYDKEKNDLVDMSPDQLTYYAGDARYGRSDEVRGAKYEKQKVPYAPYTWTYLMLQLPDGGYREMAVLVKNRGDLDSRAVPVWKPEWVGTREYLKHLEQVGSVMMPVEELERLTGMRLSKDLPANIRKVTGPNPGAVYQPSPNDKRFELISQGESQATQA